MRGEVERFLVVKRGVLGLLGQQFGELLGVDDRFEMGSDVDLLEDDRKIRWPDGIASPSFAVREFLDTRRGWGTGIRLSAHR